MIAGKATILIVEDTDVCREPLNLMLKLRGFQTLMAKDGLEAISTLHKLSEGQKRPVDLVLLDMSMPHVSGMEVLQTIRNEYLWRAIPVVILSAVSDPAVIARTKELGATDYLVKSAFSFEDLMIRLKKILGI